VHLIKEKKCKSGTFLSNKQKGACAEQQMLLK
jgi:hypothetical protein